MNVAPEHNNSKNIDESDEYDDYTHYGKVDTIQEAEEMDEETPASKLSHFKNTLKSKLLQQRSKDSNDSLAVFTPSDEMKSRRSKFSSKKVIIINTTGMGRQANIATSQS